MTARKRDRTLSLWTSEPVGMLPAGQLDLPLVQAPACGARFCGFGLPCVHTSGHEGSHSDGIGGAWGGEAVPERIPGTRKGWTVR